MSLSESQEERKISMMTRKYQGTNPTAKISKHDLAEDKV